MDAQTGIVKQLVTVEDGVQYVDPRRNKDSQEQDQQGPMTQLQVLLFPQRVLTIDHNSLCWTSDGLAIVNDSPFARWVSRDRITGHDRMTVSNQGTTPLCLTLAQNEGSDILPLKVAPRIGLMCFKDSFLCSSGRVSLEDKGFPLFGFFARYLLVLPNELYRCSLNKLATDPSLAVGEGAADRLEDIPAYVFLQCKSQIMQKRLLANETFQIRANCIVAYQESCKLSFSTAALSIKFSSPFVKFEGPGLIYFCSQTARRSNRFNSAQRDNRPVQALTMLLSVVILAVFLLSRVVDIQILEDIQEN
jgi:uncharacterized protein (AIM24 family)